MCGCGGSAAVNGAESADLIAIIHPIPASMNSADIPTALSRRDSSSSTTSTTSSLSATSASSSVSSTSNHHFIGSRLRFSNHTSHRKGLPSTTITDVSHSNDADEVVASWTTNVNVRIHRYGYPSDIDNMPNPVVHAFPLATDKDQATYCGLRLDLGLGGEGILGRTVSLSDSNGRLLGEGVLGRI